MAKDPVQMRNLHPSAPAEGGQNAFHSGENKLAGYNITRLIPRIDALLLVLKSCKATDCAKPWKALHPNADVKNLRDAMNGTFDDKYDSIPRVQFCKCFTNGTIDLAAEGPRWKGNGDVVGLCPQGAKQTEFEDNEDERMTQRYQEEWGYWDDWE